jgi:hypothetical protein
MKISRFQSDYRLWFWSALALFLSSWWFPSILDKAGGTPAERVAWLMNWVSEGNTSFGHVAEVTLEQALLAAVVSSVLAWFFHCGVVLVRTRQREMFSRIFNPRRLIYLGIAAAILLGIFPPWTATSTAHIQGASLRDLQCSWGYSFILTPPKHPVETFTIDWGRLVGQWVGIASAVGCGLLYSWQEHRRRIGSPGGLPSRLPHHLTCGSASGGSG